MYCTNTNRCQNPSENNRPTRLRASLSSYCVYCRRGGFKDPTPRNNTADGYILPPSESHAQKKELATDEIVVATPVLGRNEENSTETGLMYGHPVVRNLRLFVQNQNVELVHRQMVSRLLSDSPGEITRMLLESVVMDGHSRISELWEAGFGSMPEGIVQSIATESSRLYELQIGKSTRFLSAETKGARKIIQANPLVCGILSSQSLTAAVAHEGFHHMSNHYEVATEILNSRCDQTSSPAEVFRIQGILNDLMDVITNEPLGLTHLEFDVGDSGSPGYDRRLLALAAVTGPSAVQSANSFKISLMTSDIFEDRYGVRIDAGKAALDPEGVLSEVVDGSPENRGRIRSASST